MTRIQFRQWRRSRIPVLAALLLSVASAHAADTAEAAFERVPIPGRELTPAPANGAVLRVTPPTFRWLPAGGDATRYRIEVARDPAFRDIVYDAASLRWRIETPRKALPPGTYHWRVGVDGSADAPPRWSAIRVFEIAPDAAQLPFPDGDWIERLPAERPRLHVTPATLPARRAAAAGGFEAGRLTRLQAEVAAFAGEPLIAEPSMLPPRSDPGRRAVYAKIIGDTRRPMERMRQAALVHLLTGDAAAGAEARRRLLHFADWSPAGATGLARNDEPAMGLLLHAPVAYDWTYGLYAPEERSRIEAMLLARCRDMFRHLAARPFDVDPFDSHSGRMTAILGVAALGLAPEHSEAREWLDYLLRIYFGAYPVWGGDAGGWNEGSLYWINYMDIVLDFVAALRAAGAVDLMRKPFFRNTPYYIYYSQPPFIAHKAFGDLGFGRYPHRYGPLMRLFARMTGDGHATYYADAVGLAPGARGSDSLALLLPDATPPPVPPADLPTSRLFEDIGLAVLRNTLSDGDRHVGMEFMANPYGNVSHNHNNQNTFALSAFGEPLVLPSGSYDHWGSEYHRRWLWETRSKCGITVDGGTGQDRGWQATARITRFDEDDAFALVAGDATPAYGGRLTRAVREIVFVKPFNTFVMRDALASDTPRRFEYRLHALDAMRLDDKNQTVEITRPHARLSVNFLASEPLTLEQDDHFPVTPLSKRPEPVARWHLTASTPPVLAADLVTVLAATRPGEDAPTAERLESADAIGVRLRAAGGRTVVVGFARDGAGARISLGGVATEERFFAREAH